MKTSTLIASKKLRSFRKHHGGKSYLARRIIELFPPHDVYVEPFIGGGSILLNRVGALEEVASDLDAKLMRTWAALAEYPTAVIEGLKAFPYTEEVFKLASSRIDRPAGLNDIDYAIYHIIKNRFSRGGLGKDFAWSDRLRGGKPGDANAWDTIREELPSLTKRIKGVRFYCRTAAQIIADWDGTTTLMYLDPPYVPSTRTAKKAYDHEMTYEDHEALLVQIRGCKAAVAISGYRCQLYDAMLADWRRLDFDMPNHSGQGATKQRRVECVWMNYPEPTR